MFPSSILVLITEYMGILLSLAFFALSSFYDFKTREVDNWVWIAYGSMGLISTVTRFIVDPSTLLLGFASVVITILVSLGLFYFGLFGGADAKAIICLGVAIPLAPNAFQPVLGYFHPFFPLVVVILSFFCSASLVVWLGLRNVMEFFGGNRRMFEGLGHEARWKKAIAMVTGYTVTLPKLRSTFYLYPMESVTEDSAEVRRSFRLFVGAEADRESMVAELDRRLSEIGFKGKVWVTPGLPMLIFIFIALVISLIFGDAVFTPIILLAGR